MEDDFYDLQRDYPPYVDPSEILGAMPSIKQKNNYCSYLVILYLKHMAQFLENLIRGQKEVGQMDLYCHTTANTQYNYNKLMSITQQSSDPVSSARKDLSQFSWFNLRWENTHINWEINTTFDDRIPMSLGGFPELERESLIQYFEESFVPGTVIGVTRCEHSYFLCVIATGLAILCDSAYSHRFLVSKKGALQHFLHKDTDKDNNDPYQYFDMCDVNIVSRQDHDLLALIGTKERLTLLMDKMLFFVPSTDIDKLFLDPEKKQDKKQDKTVSKEGFVIIYPKSGVYIIS